VVDYILEGYGIIGKDALFKMFKMAGKNGVAFMIQIRYLRF